MVSFYHLTLKTQVSVCFFYFVDADMEDYGFEYSDEEQEEQDVDIENQYYNSKGISNNYYYFCFLLVARSKKIIPCIYELGNFIFFWEFSAKLDYVENTLFKSVFYCWIFLPKVKIDSLSCWYWFNLAMYLTKWLGTSS